MPFANFLTLLDPSRRMMDICLRIDSLLPAFKNAELIFDTEPDELADLIFIYMHCHLGYLAEDLEIHVDKETREYSSMWDSIGSWIAREFRLPVHSNVKRWYHYVLPYQRKQVVTFDDDQIRELLNLASSDPECKTSGFVADCLVKTVNTKYQAVLPKRSASFTVTVGIGQSSLRSKHTYEVTEE